MKLCFDDFLLADNKIWHVIEINCLEYVILFFHITYYENLDQNDIN